MVWGLWEQTVAVASVWVISLITIYENKENKCFHYKMNVIFMVWKTFILLLKNFYYFIYFYIGSLNLNVIIITIFILLLLLLCKS